MKPKPRRCIAGSSLAQAIPKGKNMDLIVQKAVEIGAAEIFPLISERTIVDLDKKEAAQKQAKWQQIAIEAAKQCGQNWLPEVHTPQKLKPFFDHVATGLPAAPKPGVGVRPVSGEGDERWSPGGEPPNSSKQGLGTSPSTISSPDRLPSARRPAFQKGAGRLHQAIIKPAPPMS